jgi:predicted metal-dependent peptidase
MGEFLPDPEVKSEAEAAAASQEYDQEFIGAVLAAQQQGKCPGWAAERAEAICAPAKIPWQVLLRRWARKVVRGGESTYSRPSRRSAYRTDIVLPSKRSQSIRRCLFIVDTSGSMGTKEVNAAVPEMLKIMATWKRAELVVIQCDAAVADETTYKPGTGFRELQAFARSPQWRGRGGTDMGPAFALIPKYRPEVVICLTDGYLTWPDEADAHGIPVCWLMVNDSVVPPWGQRIVLEV